MLLGRWEHSYRTKARREGRNANDEAANASRSQESMQYLKNTHPVPQQPAPMLPATEHQAKRRCRHHPDERERSLCRVVLTLHRLHFRQAQRQVQEGFSLPRAAARAATQHRGEKRRGDDMRAASSREEQLLGRRLEKIDQLRVLDHSAAALRVEFRRRERRVVVGHNDAVR